MNRLQPHVNSVDGKRRFACSSVAVLGIIVNKKELIDYFRRPTLEMIVRQPFVVTQTEGQYDVRATVKGGGLSGQAGAMVLGISRALLKENEELRKQLRDAGFLTRDPREKERKKYGQPGARKRFQFSKR